MKPSKKSDIGSAMEQKFSLEAAGKLFGVSANAMRARAKKNPEKYRVERDNSGKIWLWLDPINLPSPQKSAPEGEASILEQLKVSIEGLKSLNNSVVEIENLKGQIEAERRLREAAETDRDRWQAMAEKLGNRPSWWARLLGRSA